MPGRALGELRLKMTEAVRSREHPTVPSTPRRPGRCHNPVELTSAQSYSSSEDPFSWGVNKQFTTKQN